MFFSFQLDGGINGRCRWCSKVPCIHLDKCYCCSAAAPLLATQPAWWVEAVQLSLVAMMAMIAAAAEWSQSTAGGGCGAAGRRGSE